MSLGFEIIISNLAIGTFSFFLFFFLNKNKVSGFWDYTKFVLPIFIAYYIFYFGGVFLDLQFYRTELLWNPYTFAGMPSFAAGVKWYNHIQILINVFTKAFLTNPIFTALFIISIYWIFLRIKNGKKLLLNYFFLLFTEFLMLLLTDWSI